MEEKTFLGLPIISNASWQATLKHLLGVILFTGLGYFIVAIVVGQLNTKDPWYYIQQEEKDYWMQFGILLGGTLLGHLLRILGNLRRPFFFILPWLDKWIYPLGFILAYLVINEIWGL